MSGQNRNMMGRSQKPSNSEHVHGKRKIWIEYNTEAETSSQDKFPFTIKTNTGIIGRVNKKVALSIGKNHLHL
jgi:hypothetical protein